MILPILGILCMIIFASGCVSQGSGNVTNETRNVTAFNQIISNGNSEVIVTQGSNNSLVIEGDSNIIPDVQTNVENNQLTITNNNIGTGKPPKIYITVVDLNGVQIGGSGNLTGTNLKHTDLSIYITGSGSVNMDNMVANSLKFVNSGSGKCQISGNIKNQDILITGSGEYNSKDLQSNNAKVEIDGSGNAIMNVVNQLNIIINGSGQVSYIGNPNINQQVTGSGTVKKIG